MDWNIILTGIAIPVGRSVLGWVENSMKDGIISNFEWSQLGSTVFRVGVLQAANIGLLGSLGGNAEFAVIAGSCAAVLQDILLQSLKKLRPLSKVKNK